MKNSRFWKALFLYMMGFICFAVPTARANDAGVQKTITSDKCANFNLAMIPVVTNFVPVSQLPINPLIVSQKYDTTYKEGYYSKDGTWLYGHDGLDVVNSEKTPGKNDIKAIHDGYVILSMSAADTGGVNGWGETIIIATRPNQYSNEIITHHYHHMHWDYKTGTTRKFNACEAVKQSDVVGKEGKTGNVDGVHLHQGIRRWKNLKELQDALNKGGHAIFGYGYTMGDDSKIAKNLDPNGILYDTFRDYQLDSSSQPPPYKWSLPYVLDMRHRGIEFGRFDGRYGAGESVLRREAARWLKIAAQRPNSQPVSPTFVDVPAKDSDYPYIQALIDYPSVYPVINQDANPVSGQRHFYPDAVLTRAQALKMVVLSFYSSEFLILYNDFIWKAEKAAATLLLSKFQDVSPNDWYATFVYFGAQKGLVAVQQNFHPSDAITREEMAKWVSDGAASIQAQAKEACSSVICPVNAFCAPATGKCVSADPCIPSETQTCEIGGGYNPSDACMTLSECSMGDTQTQSCNGGSGMQTRTCQVDCTWSPWGSCITMMPMMCTPGKTDQQSCTAGGLPGTQTRICDSTGQWGSWSACTPSCQDVYLASASPACYTTPGGPTLCLYVQQVSGSSWKYQVCKQGSFIYNYKSVFKDDNHFVQLDTYTGNVGDTCTPWHTFGVSYLSGYGTSNGAGLRAVVSSPASCTQSSCQYPTGTVTVYKQCQ